MNREEENGVTGCIFIFGLCLATFGMSLAFGLGVGLATCGLMLVTAAIVHQRRS